jgi:nicotinate phosphoribosyltransferase
MGRFKPTGVNQILVEKVRGTLNFNRFRDVNIVVSGGFNADKISTFERDKVPVDVYGVGSALLKGSNDYTADVVIVDGHDLAKAGRHYTPFSR